MPQKDAAIDRIFLLLSFLKHPQHIVSDRHGFPRFLVQRRPQGDGFGQQSPVRLSQQFRVAFKEPAFGLADPCAGDDGVSQIRWAAGSGSRAG